MKIKSLLSLLILVVSPTLFAQVDESLFNDDSVFVQCILEDGRQLTATNYLVAVGDVILSKNLVATSMSRAADWTHYQSTDYEINVYKQFCGRGGVQGVEIIHLTGSGILGTTSLGTVQVISCNERDQCITNDDSML